MFFYLQHVNHHVVDRCITCSIPMTPWHLASNQSSTKPSEKYDQLLSHVTKPSHTTTIYSITTLHCMMTVRLCYMITNWRLPNWTVERWRGKFPPLAHVVFKETVRITTNHLVSLFSDCKVNCSRLPLTQILIGNGKSVASVQLSGTLNKSYFWKRPTYRYYKEKISCAFLSFCVESSSSSIWKHNLYSYLHDYMILEIISFLGRFRNW